MHGLFCSIFLTLVLFLNSTFSASEDASKGQCLEPEQCFQDMVNECGMDYAVYYAINADMDFTQELIKHRDKTEPIIRNMIENPGDFSPSTVGRACSTAYKMDINDLLEAIQKLAFDGDDEIRRFAQRAFVRMCPPVRFPVILKLMEIEKKNTKGTLLHYALERKIVDPDLLEKWRDDQLEKDKERDTKVMPDWFVRKVNEAIRSMREHLGDKETDPSSNKPQSVISTSAGNDKNQ